MRNLTSQFFLTLLVIALGVTALGGCSDTFLDPFENEDQYFTVWGYIDQLEMEHELRVMPITRFPEEIRSPSDPQAFLDAEVFTTDINTGVRTRWFHSLEQLADGTYGHVFTARFLVNERHTYRLEVIRSDGKMTVAETKVPSIIDDFLVQKDEVKWENDSTLVYQDFHLPSIASPWEINAIYYWEGGDQSNILLIPYGRVGVRTDDGGWTVRINISDDQADVRDHVVWAKSVGIVPPNGPHGLTSMGIQTRILDANWDPPGGVFDPDVLAQPGAYSNVENGMGFFGSIGLYRQEWNASELSIPLGYDF